MTIVLRLDASVTGDASITNPLNALLVDTVADGAEVIHRDLTAIPALSAARFAANMTPAADRTLEQTELAQAADQAIADLEAADIVVIGAPIYNFGVPSGVKAWMDLVARAGRTFAYTEEGPQGLVTGKVAYIVSASGGVPLGSPVDFATPHLTQFLQFLGFTEITVIDAGGLMMDDSKLDQAKAQIRALALALRLGQPRCLVGPKFHRPFDHVTAEQVTMQPGIRHPERNAT